MAEPSARTPSTRAAILEEVVNDIIERFGEVDLDDIASARKEFDDRRGRVFEDEELWEDWTRAFLEWYVIERVMPGDDYPPAARLLGAERDPLRAAAIRALLTSQRSLYEVRALRPAGVELADILGGASFAVAEERAMHGVSVGDIAELRLIGFDGDVLFGGTFCFHPAGTRASILAHARRIRANGGERRDVVDYCASLRIRCERYRHVAATRVYEAAITSFPRAEDGSRGS